MGGSAAHVRVGFSTGRRVGLGGKARELDVMAGT